MNTSFDQKLDRTGGVSWLKDLFTPDQVRQAGLLSFAGAEFEFPTCPALSKAVADYLEKNPVQAGATAEEAAQIQRNKENIEKAVKSVNGSLPDQNGNVSITVPEAVTDAHIISLIDAKLGVIENGTY